MPPFAVVKFDGLFNSTLTTSPGFLILSFYYYLSTEIIVSGGMTMPQVITPLGPALDKNQGTHLNRMMTV